jgi:hypothetical protein
MLPSAVRKSLQVQDDILISDLERRLTRRQVAGEWRNVSLRRQKALRESEAGLKTLRATLEKVGAFSIRLERRPWRDLDGERRTFTLARAASTEMWPMGTHYWVRDNAIIGARYLFARDGKRNKEGKDLLLSALTFMSSQSQLARFEKIVKSSSAAFREDPANGLL